MLKVPWSPSRKARRSGSKRDILVLFVGNNRRILVPRHLFGPARDFEELVTAVEERVLRLCTTRDQPAELS